MGTEDGYNRRQNAEPGDQDLWTLSWDEFCTGSDRKT